MWAKWTVAVLAAACLTGCISQPHYRPCGPGFLNNALVPQGFAGVDFRRACQRHDDCYGAGCDRKACDDRFLNDMLRACECSPMPCLCRLKAYQWYLQVRLLGGIGYQEGGGCGCGQCGACPHCGGCAEACGAGCCETCNPPCCGCGQ